MRGRERGIQSLLSLRFILVQRERESLNIHRQWSKNKSSLILPMTAMYQSFLLTLIQREATIPSPLRRGGEGAKVEMEREKEEEERR